LVDLRAHDVSISVRKSQSRAERHGRFSLSWHGGRKPPRVMVIRDFRKPG
jgi:hypothetical protein